MAAENISKFQQEYDAIFTKISKMKIVSCNKDRKQIESKTMSINPESYTRKFSSLKGKGKNLKMADGRNYSEKNVEFVETVSFELWFDDTGAIPADKGSKGVVADLAWLEKNLASFDGELHAARYVTIMWGALNLFGQLKSLDIQYLYFSQNGTPVRAKASLVCEGIQNVAGKKQSPDLTHLRTIRAGDTLPALCYQIYNDPKYYVQVAAANGLPHFTSLEPGQKIYFPPLE